ncbi:MAG TPA: hypothetical protein VMZ28_22320 [Kofleriaceae bacterium]|nr:hypothetical protein [Kofleriaceae bacterium]
MLASAPAGAVAASTRGRVKPVVRTSRTSRTAVKPRTPTRAPRATALPRPARTARRTAAASHPVALSAARGVTLKELSGTAAQRETIAMRAVATEARRRVGGKWDVTLPFDQFVGDKTNPITGSGPIVVNASRKTRASGVLGFLGRLVNPNAQRRFVVMVDPGGRPTILESRPNGPLYRVGRRAIEALPLASDIVKSRGVRIGSLLSGGGLVAVTTIGGPIGLGVAGLLGLYGTNEMREGVQRRNEARADALDHTLHGWPGASTGGRARHARPGVYQLLRRKGGTVTLSEAHNLYKLNLEELKPGTEPLDIAEFAGVLAANGL